MMTNYNKEGFFIAITIERRFANAGDKQIYGNDY